jgi:hypothetical protein
VAAGAFRHHTCLLRFLSDKPHIAEGLTGRTFIRKHLYWHASSQFGPEWAIDYLGAPVCDWLQQEIDFVGWIFNSSAVLHERTRLMALQEAPGEKRLKSQRQAGFRPSRWSIGNPQPVSN